MEEAIEVSEEHPVLIDKFLEEAIEVDVDAICDGENVFVAGIMEHIEHAGVHSGDSACVLPPVTLSEEVKKTIIEYTEKIARALNTVGLINIQFAVKDKVYVLEVNPRASRTVPFVSKAINVPLAKIATKIMLGKKLKDFGLIGYKEPKYYAVKEAVFPFIKLPGVDPVLGPEMKSTGEVMGIDFDFGKAYYKAQLAAGNRLPLEGTIFISVRRQDRNGKLVYIAKKLKELGFNLIATKGTARFLNENGVNVKIIKKISEGSENILDLMLKKKVDLIINTPTSGKIPFTDGYYIRRYAVDLRIPYITTIAGALAAVKAIESVKKGDISVMSLEEYYKRDRELKKEVLAKT